MKRLKEKGITLIALVITIAILSLLSAPIIVKSSMVVEFGTYGKFKEDIDNLRENISIAFFDDDISEIGPEYTGNKDFLGRTQNGYKVKNVNDNEKYYVIMIGEINSRLKESMSKLNYGKENYKSWSNDVYSGTDDVYIINEESRTIYYVSGIKYKGKRYFRLQEDMTEITAGGVEPGEVVKDFNRKYTDKNGNTAIIPQGYKVSEKEEEQTIKEGLVIVEATTRDEYVWIPVQEMEGETEEKIEIKYDRYVYGSEKDGGKESEYDSKKIYSKEGDTKYYYEKKDDFEALSVIENKGFYIGRYETGTTVERTETTQKTEAVVKKNVNVYNYVTKSEAEQICSSTNSQVTSKLCSGYAWDTVLKFIEASGKESYITNSEGNYTNTLKKTGNTVAINNIYDLAGNVYELTTERSSNSSEPYSVRGGAINTTAQDKPVSSRTSVGEEKRADIGFRKTLFLNIAGPTGKQLVKTVTDTNHEKIIGEDSLGNLVVIPGGFRFAGKPEDTVEDGIIIADDEGNEFVWVPVSNIDESGRRRTVAVIHKCLV